MVAKLITRINNPGILDELKTFPNQAFIWFIVNSENPYMWELPSKEAIMIMEPYSDDPFVFLAGKLSTDDIEEVIKLCSMEYPRIYCNNFYHPEFLKKGWDFHLRVELSYEDGNSPLTLEKGWEIKNIDNIELMKQCYKYQKYSNKNGSPESFCKSNKGYVLCFNNKVISELYVTHNSSSPYAEISIRTDKNYRGKGAATKLTKYVAEKYKASNLIVIWSCQIDNRASLKTALKSGFKIDRYYINMVPDVGNTLSPILENWINENTPINWEG